ncbi:Thiopurine S-methyltransferase [Armadillidium vulgare]|nr:Thiopurine S-methyltransferase [Armadillidium vulgare]
MEQSLDEFGPIVKKATDSKLMYKTLWFKNLTPWETSEVHPYLKEHSSGLDLCAPKRVLVPFCGNAVELKWFYEKGLEVVGVEFVEKPVKKFFTQHNLKYEVREIQGETIYETLDKRLKIYVSDFLDVHANDIGKFDVIWDRLAQVALEPCNREKYSNLMKTHCKDEFTYFLFTLQFEKPGNPDVAPISVPHEESKKMYGMF